MKSVSALIAVLAGASDVAAFWRMPCRSQTGIGRLDPIVDPGMVSDHVHTIHGGGGFGFNADYDTLNASGSCTSCEVTQDHSAYWTPTLNFQYSNGTTVMVEQVGGMLAYYLSYLEDVKAFPQGFQMLAGNKNIRNFTGPVPDTPLSFWPTDPTDQFFLQQRALGFNCLNYAVAPEPSLYRHTFPQKDYMDAHCLDGLRLEMAFPSCWNGQLDSPDHSSHVAYPSLVKEGNCPSGYEQHLPFLFFETIWATNAFSGEDGMFLLANGDPVGTGYHGDFMMGWESEEFLQDALDTCTNPSGEIQDCPLFNIQSDPVGAECTFPMPEVLQNDNPRGPRNGLAVDVPVQYGPAPATAYPVAGRSGQATSSMAAATAPASFAHGSTWSYSAANPSDSGINVHVPASAMVPNKAEPQVTAAPSLESAAPSGHIISTSYITNGFEVLEMVVEQVDVTVTASPSAPAGAEQQQQQRRHLHQHLQHLHHGVRR